MRPAHVSAVVAVVLAELALGGCGRARRFLGEDYEPDHSRRRHADGGERRRGSRERERPMDSEERETAYRERMRARDQARAHQRALDRSFGRELYLSDVTDWLEGRPAGER